MTGVARAGEKRSRTGWLVRAEAPYRERGVLRLAGVDEAGVAPLAGPVVAAAVIMPVESAIRGVDDSKTIGARRRGELAAAIRAEAVAWGIGLARPREIDRVNIYWATLAAMRRAVLRLRVPPEHVLVDARTIPDLPWSQEGHVKGDARFYQIACASLIAKTFRDALMIRLDRRWPGYGFARNMGYPTPEHQAAIRRLGPSPVHRRSFRWSKEDPRQTTLEDLLAAAEAEEGGAQSPAM